MESVVYKNTVFMVGHKLFCHTNLFLSNGPQRGKKCLTAGSIYTIINFRGNCFVVKDDMCVEHSISFGRYEDWFNPPIIMEELDDIINTVFNTDKIWV